MNYIKDGAGIYAKSFAIVERGLEGLDVSPQVREVMKRAAHATADIEFGRNLIVRHESVMAGMEAFRKGAPLIADVTMVRAGIRKAPLKTLGVNIHCFLYDDDVAASSSRENVTKSIMAMRKAVGLYPEGVFVIGNAPTAVFELCEQIDAGKARPSLVVGIPIGFVGAAECKVELIKRGVPHITNVGPKGGSPVAAAISNALLSLAEEDN